MSTDPDPKYFMLRAEVELAMAEAASSQEAASSHRQLAVAYLTRVQNELRKTAPIEDAYISINRIM